MYHNYESKYEQVVRVEKQDHIAVITLCNAEDWNRVTEQSVDQLTAALEDIQYDKDIFVAVLHGEGPISFGPGSLDIIASKLAKNVTECREIMQEIGNMMRRLYYLRVPVIGVAERKCIGAGASLAFSTDILIADEKASFVEIFVDYGLIPDTGGLYALQRLVGPMQAKAIAMQGDPLSAQQAKELGLVYQVAPKGTALEAGMALARKLAAKPPLALSQIKQISNRMQDYTLDTYFQAEADNMAFCTLGRDFKELMKAMQEKREPEFKGY
ncbi:MAG: enoyl-CoA hydratase/isomerase family protein [Syntrophomonadaceae bacterium]|nr:enoyl-CoA hydratase/isomerase family protein [Syntrophomonadaceae bacterium]